MGRKFSSSMIRAIQAADRASRMAARNQAAAIRAQEKFRKLSDRRAKQKYLDARLAEVDDENKILSETVRELESILASGLARNASVDFNSLHRKVNQADLPDSLKTLVQPSSSDFLPLPLGFWAGLLPNARNNRLKAVAAGEARYQSAKNQFEKLTAERFAALKKLQDEADTHNLEIEALKVGVQNGDAVAIKIYSGLVLGHSPYPDGFPQDTRIGLVAESKQLVVDLRAPLMADIVPDMERFKYVKAQDTILGSKRPDKAKETLYSSAIAQMSLRTLHELFQADIQNHIQIIVLNVYLRAVDPSTGKNVQPYILSIRVGREEFTELQLASVEPLACLRRLKASVSRSATELVPVRPIVDINMADPRFIDEQDIISTLDTRPNLMELSPGEFESLITNLFQAMGLDTKLTQASRDGGVDCVAFDPRPVLGGKVIVQAKRYKNTVGVSAVRDLFGTVHNEGATKGILVTTSGFGKAAYTFANAKPLELITGSNLLYLLQEHAGVAAKIEPPDDWVDPVLDIAN